MDKQAKGLQADMTSDDGGFTREGHPFLDKIQGLAAQVTGAQPLWEAPSATHALAWLQFHLEWQGTIGLLGDVINGKRRVELPPMVLFRGQAEAGWAVQSGLQRLLPAERKRARLASSLFAQVAYEMFREIYRSDGMQDYPRPSRRAGSAAAQHYGMRTNLLDFTTNALVAMWFACPAPNMKPAPSQSAIDWIDLKTAKELGLRIVLPPVFVDRPYLQRGVFLEVPRSKLAQLRGRLNRIVFPSAQRFEFVRVFGDGLPRQLDLLPADDWLEKLKVWATQESAKSPAERDAGMPALFQFTVPHGCHPAMHRTGMEGLLGLGDTIEVMLDFVDRMALRTVKGGLIYHPDTVGMLANDNPEFFSWLLRGVAPDESGITVMPHNADLKLKLRKLAATLRHHRMAKA
ncbi:FRG domain-containing protein [Mesorhizobium sp. KR2-14]|uniref:FRG domain-containing protein n=1 Tax=Mesorhizobium sp. KR2-14 TaxID=3156610 RepID=UPI0032B520A6